MSTSYQPIAVTDNRLSFVSRNVFRIPSVLSKLYGTKVTSLDISFNNITDLSELEYFHNLTELILDNNCLDDNVIFPFMPSLGTLSLNNNKITDLEKFLKQIKKIMPQLNYLSLLGNLACPNQLSDSEKDEEDYQRYRYYVLYHLPNLKFLDFRKVTEDELQESLRKGQYMKIVRPSHNNMCTKDHKEDNSVYTPLTNLQANTRHQGIYGRCLYRYIGKNSEGNRFIRNHEL